MEKVHCIFYPAGLEAARLKALAESCLRFSSQVSLRPWEAVFLETGGNRLIHEPDALALRLKRLAERYGAQPRLARGRHAAEALALARYGGSCVEELPLKALSDYASPFQPDSTVEAWMEPMIGALGSLGLGRLGSLLRLPAKSVGERFGAEAACLRGRVAGIFDMAWPRFEPEPAMTERERFEAVEDFGRLCFHLKRLADRMGARLRGRELRAARLDLGLKFESGKKTGLTIALSLPQSSPSAILALLRESLDSKRRQGWIWEPVTAMELSAPDRVPGNGSQGSFFDSRQREMEAWSSLVLRLRQRLGEDQVFLAELVQRYLPERAWKKLLLEPEAQPRQAADPACPKRPSRLLGEPKSLWQEGAVFIQMPEKKRWHARAWEGPERINGEWWKDGFDRDYFRVATEEGMDLWVYSLCGTAAGQKKFWLHGYFD